MGERLDPSTVQRRQSPKARLAIDSSTAGIRKDGV